ncbi:hypothetical protein M422DRAFT_30892, partial [Sphaerobolus stellatus SS14]
FTRRGGRQPSSIEASLGSAAYTVQRTGIDSEHTEDIAEILGSSGTFSDGRVWVKSALE